MSDLEFNVFKMMGALIRQLDESAQDKTALEIEGAKLGESVGCGAGQPCPPPEPWED